MERSDSPPAYSAEFDTPPVPPEGPPPVYQSASSTLVPFPRQASPEQLPASASALPSSRLNRDIQRSLSQSSASTESDSSDLDARCLSGDHDPFTRYGTAGMMLAIILFPVGLLCLKFDREKRCSRCGDLLDGKVSC